MTESREKLRKAQLLVKLRLLQQGKAALGHERELGKLRKHEQVLDQMGQDYRQALGAALPSHGLVLNPELQSQRMNAIESIYLHAAAARATVETCREACRQSAAQLVEARVCQELADRAELRARNEWLDLCRRDEEIDQHDAQMKTGRSGRRHG